GPASESPEERRADRGPPLGPDRMSRPRLPQSCPPEGRKGRCRSGRTSLARSDSPRIDRAGFGADESPQLLAVACPPTIEPIGRARKRPGERGKPTASGEQPQQRNQ